NNFLSILENNGVDLVLSGHSHSYERSYFLNGHYGLSNTFNSSTHTVGANGDLSGKEDQADGPYTKTASGTQGTVYITTGSAGKISGGSLNHKAIYASINQLGSCVLEIDNDGATGQNLNVKFLTMGGTIADYFTINKTGVILSTENKIDNSIKAYPVPAKTVINIKIPDNETVKNIRIFSIKGVLIKESNDLKTDVKNLASGQYILEITTNKNSTYKKIIIK
ncbi:MAG: T9SS type A sorting domain-containing protein, partial [Gelidibacter sp.]